nr:alpha/beta fold hydrolase [Echinimonas agarilytica]
MAINALLTLPPQIPAKDLPAVVMPHGGPESYDQISFDFMAQYFASQGYAVIQPNFRGSTGFGTAYKLAGRGEWGRKMQDDVTDSLKHFATQGVVDADRVCIVGASYGGYSALAGGAFTPELYKCVVAIAPVADLPLMMKDTQRYTSKYSWVRTYWDRVIQDGNADDDMLEAISPINHVNKFKAPVLLIHGNDDTVVPMKQSLAMEDALEDADKTVTFIELHKEDHYLSNPRTRLEALEATGSFVNKYLN